MNEKFVLALFRETESQKDLDTFFCSCMFGNHDRNKYSLAVLLTQYAKSFRDGAAHCTNQEL